jgi:hypothetical protein
MSRDVVVDDGNERELRVDDGSGLAMLQISKGNVGGWSLVGRSEEWIWK